LHDKLGFGVVPKGVSKRESGVTVKQTKKGNQNRNLQEDQHLKLAGL